MNLLVALGCFALLSVAFCDEEAWKEHVEKHSLQFNSDHHHNRSKAVFLQSKNFVESHNLKFHAKQVSYSVKLNKFSHMSENELAQYRGFKETIKSQRDLSADVPSSFNGCPVTFKTLSPTAGWAAPASFDVETRWKVPVRDQQDCGSCWAFAAVQSLEGAAKFQLNKVTGSLSAQQIVDCVTCGVNGCDGGMPLLALNWVKTNGNKALATDASYSYQSVQGMCRSAASPYTNVKSVIWSKPGSDLALQETLVKFGPPSIAMDVSPNGFMSYSTGIFDGAGCTQRCNHAMVLVGYGNENGIPFWRVKNQWGEWWGDKGYIKVSRARPNMCGIAEHAVIAAAA